MIQLRKRHRSLYSFKNRVYRLVNAGRLNQSLCEIHDFVDRIFTEPLCTSQVFGSKHLDGLCQHIGQLNLNHIKKTTNIEHTDKPHKPVIVYIVTKIEKSGGHSQVIHDFIKAKPDAHHIILSTELAGKSDVQYLSSKIVKQNGVFFESSPKVNYLRRLTWLQNRLTETYPQKVYLFNHHQDSVAVAAIQPEMKFDVYFYHHGDHHLCLGVCLSHLKHIDPHPMGYHNCRKTLGVNNIYLPLTIEDQGDRPHDKPFGKGELTTCTAARSNKIEIPYFISYLDIVPRIIKTTGGKHIHIGRLSPWALWRIRNGLKRLGIQSERFIYTPWVPSVWKSLHQYEVDLYIASFPYGGGLTLIETMGAGVPVALHKHFFSRLLSGIDMAYPNAFSWRTPDELLEYCSKVTPAMLESGSRSARARYLKFHNKNVLNNFLRDRDNSALEPDDLKHLFLPEYDEWATWVEGQISIKKVIQRGIYRKFRRIRNKFF